MSTLRVNNLQNTSTTDGGISINNSGHVTMDGVAYPSAGPLSNRNLIINGDMRIDQRNGGSSTTPTSDGTYVFDRWMIRNATGSGRFSVQQSGTTPNSIDPSMLLTVTTTASPSAGEFYSVEQRVEGYVLAQSALGTSASKTLTLSFWVRSSLTGTYCCSLRNAGADRSFVAEYSISSADTWEHKTIQISAQTGGTWNTTNGTGAYVDWCLGVGTNFQGSTGWNSSNRVATSNQTNWIGTSGATFYITGVQLEVGSVATPFEHRSYGDELARCERYYQEVDLKNAAAALNIVCSRFNSSAGAAHAVVFFRTKMRANPAFTFSGTTQSTANAYGGDPTLISSTVDCANIATTNTVDAGGVLFLRVSSVAGSTLKLEFSSEL